MVSFRLRPLYPITLLLLGCMQIWIRDSSGGVVTRQWTRRPCNCTSNSGRSNRYFLFQNFQTTSGAHPTGDFSFAGAQREPPNLHQLPKPYPSIPPHAFVACTFVPIQILLALCYGIKILPHIQCDAVGVGHAVPTEPFTYLPLRVNSKGVHSII